MFRQFKFEEPIYQKLDQIPISTQFKLETMGFQFPLEAWNQLVLAERWVFCHLPIRSKGEKDCYNSYLSYVLRRQGFPLPAEGTAPPEKKAWEDLSRLPSEVAQKMRDLNLPLFWPEWIKLDDMERFTLCKFCRENTGDALILQVVQEFLGLSSLTTAHS